MQSFLLSDEQAVAIPHKKCEWYSTMRNLEIRRAIKSVWLYSFKTFQKIAGMRRKLVPIFLEICPVIIIKVIVRWYIQPNKIHPKLNIVLIALWSINYQCNGLEKAKLFFLLHIRSSRLTNCYTFDVAPWVTPVSRKKLQLVPLLSSHFYDYSGNGNKDIEGSEWLDGIKYLEIWRVR